MGRASKGATGKKKDEDIEQEQCLQAVVLADSFERSFEPVTASLETGDNGVPKCLMEVCGVPLLEYSLAMLARAGAGEILVACALKADAVRLYLSGRRLLGREGREVKLRVLDMRGCGSSGDVLRELDQRGAIKSDPFVMTTGDSVCSIDCVRDAIAEHQARKAAGADATLSLILCEGGTRMREHGTPVSSEDVIVALAAGSCRVVAWRGAAHAGGPSSFEVSARTLAECGSVEVRADLIDARVDICSPEVLWRYSENFDYQHPRHDFVANEVANVELGQRVHAKIASGPGYTYGCSLADPRALQLLSADVLCGWVRPPLSLGTPIARCGVGAYGDTFKKLPSSATIGRPVYLGRGVSIGERCCISRSVVGWDTVVCDDAIIQTSTLGKRCRVGEGASVKSSLVADGVQIGAGCVVPRGCVINAHLQAGTQLEPYTRLPSPAKDEDEQDDHCEEPFDRSKAPGGDDDALLAKAASWRDDWDGMPAVSNTSWNTQALITAGQATDDEFTRTVRDMVVSGYLAGSDVNSMLMELNCYKLSENRTFRDAAPAALEAIFEIAKEQADPSSLAALVRSLKQQINIWAALIGKLLGDDPDDQAHVVAVLADHLDTILNLSDVFRAFLQLLYDADLVLEDAILAWAASNTTTALVTSPQITEFLAWLEEEEEDADEEDDDEEDTR